MPKIGDTTSAELAALIGALTTIAHTGAVDDETPEMGYMKQVVTEAEAILAECVILKTTEGSPEDRTYHQDLTTIMSYIYFPHVFKSEPQVSLIATAPAGDLSCPSIVVAGLPTGFTVTHAFLSIKWSKIVNGNGAANALSGTQYIQLKLSSGSYTNAIKIVDGLYPVAGSAEGESDVLWGDINLATTVTGNGTYEIQWTQALAALASLTFKNVQFFLEIRGRLSQ